MQNEGLRLGMMLAGILVAMVPISLAVGVGIYLLRRYLMEKRRAGPSEPDDALEGR